MSIYVKVKKTATNNDFKFYSRFNGLPITRRSWLQAAPIVASMSGTCLRSAKSRALRTPRMVHQSFCSFMEDILLKFPTSPGTPTTLGSSAPSPRTTSCKSGKWPRTSITTKRLTHRHQRLRTSKCISATFYYAFCTRNVLSYFCVALFSKLAASCLSFIL
jgi:hypothetical protein